MAKLIVKEIGSFAPSNFEEGVHVLFSAHGVPKSYIEAGDPYKAQIEDCVRLISDEVRAQLLNDSDRPDSIEISTGRALSGKAKEDCDANEEKDGSVESSVEAKARPVEFHLSFQSRVGPIKWLEPYTEDMLKDLGKNKNVKNLVVVPVSFVSEHIETLEEIDIEYRHVAEEEGIKNWRRASALNTDEGFINDLADLVVIFY